MNRNRSYQILIFIIVIAIFILQGCIDDPVKYDGTVEGTVFDQYGMYNPYVLLSVGDYPIVSTDNYGHFTIENSAYPYNLTIAGRFGSHTEKYSGITLPATQIYTFKSYGYANNCNVNVIFPLLTGKYDVAIIKFISKDNSLQFDDITFHDSVFQFNVAFRNDQDQIEGKLIFLQCTSLNEIISYDKFGMMNAVLDRGSQTFIFTEDNIKYNPKEIYSYFNLQISDFNNWNSHIELNFKGMHQNSAIRLPSYYGNSNYSSFVIPELPMLNYNIKFLNYAYPDTISYSQYSKKWVFVEQGEHISLTHNKSIDLELPVNGETNVNDNTKFTFTDHKPGGVYIYRISADELQNYSLDIVTDKYPLELRDFKTWNYPFKPNTVYYWSVLKYPGFKNINDFASSNVLDDSLNTEIPASELFTFTIQ